MAKSLEGPPQESSRPYPLADALAKNRQVTDDLKRAADDLAVVHAVLEAKVARIEADEEIKRAVAETNSVEKRLDESAGTLDKVNETLEQASKCVP